MMTSNNSLCKYCLSHNYRRSGLHRCRFRHCGCDLCLNNTSLDTQYTTSTSQTDSVVNRGTDPMVATESLPMSAHSSHQNNGLTAVVDNFTNETDSETTDPIEVVRGFARELSQLDASDEDIRTCVLYTLLKKNDFSVEETVKMICFARRVITESLVLPAFDSNLLLRPKRQISCVQTVGKSDVNQNKRLCEEVMTKAKAKKSFAFINTKSDKNCDNYVETNGRNEVKSDSNAPKLTTSPTIICPKVFVMPSNVTNIPNIASDSSIVSPNKGPMSSTFVTSKGLLIAANRPTKGSIISTSNGKTVSKEISIPKAFVTSKGLTISTTNSQSKGPSIAPKNDNSILSRKESFNDKYIQSLRNYANIAPKPHVLTENEALRTMSAPISPLSTTYKIMPIDMCSTDPNVHSMKIRILKQSGLLSTVHPIPCTPATVMPTPSTLSPQCITNNSNNKSITDKNVNSFEKIEKIIKRSKRLEIHNTIHNSIHNSNQIQTNICEEMKNYFKSSENRDEIPLKSCEKLCAKIITTEAALAALSTMSETNSNSSFGNTKTNEFKDNEEYILPDEEYLDKECVERVSTNEPNLKTSTTNQVMNNRFNNSFNSTNNSSDEEVLEITID